MSPKARQIRLTALWLMPVAAIERVDQCVALAGCSSSVLTITRSTSSSEMVRGLAGPRLVVQPVQAVLGEPAPPLAHRNRGVVPPLVRIDHVLTKGRLAVTAVSVGQGLGERPSPLVADVAVL